MIALHVVLCASISSETDIITGWRLASSADLGTASGAVISRGQYDDSQWQQLQHFPTTVLAALAANGSAPHANFSLPLYHGLGVNKTQTSLFDVPWWYRVRLPAAAVFAAASGNARVLLTLRGVNYRANVWVNGVLLARRSGNVEGTFRYHHLDATAALAAADPSAAVPALAIAVSRSYDYGLDCPHGTATVPENQQVSCRSKSKAQSQDLAISFVDWAPAPHDANLGLWRGVSLSLLDAAAAVTVRYPQVTTRVLPSGAALLEVMAEVQLWGELEETAAAAAVVGTLTAAIPGLFECVSKELSLRPGEAAQRVVITPDDCPALLLRGATTRGVLWFPWQMGPPTQHNLTTSFAVTPSVSVVQQSKRSSNSTAAAPAPKAAAAVLRRNGSATSTTRTILGTTQRQVRAALRSSSTTLVGLREANVSLDANANAVLWINGQRLFVLGGGWAPDLLQRVTHRRNAQQLHLARDLGLNTIRLEGKFQDDDFFAQASALGLIVLPGLCCCDAWQNWEVWTNHTYAVAMASMSDQVKRLRAHASVAAFLYSSDQLPPPHVEAGYLRVFKEQRWANGLIASAADTTSTLTGPSGVKMAGPYGWVPPNYWYTDTNTRRYGSAFGFATEISPGAAPLTLDSMEKTVDADAMWEPRSPDGGPTAEWNYHCGASFGAFGSLRHFSPALAARYGASASAEEYLAMAQLAAYESHRAMFEGYSSLRWRNATGIVQWMLNSAWPSNMWHLFDNYLQVGGSFFGAKKAISQPLHLVYAYDEPQAAAAAAAATHPPANTHRGTKRGTISIVNSRYVEDGGGLTVEATQFDLSGHALHTQTLALPAAVAGNTAKSLFCLDAVTAASNATVLLRLRLLGRSGTANWYWLPPRLDAFEMGGCFTGCTIDRFADMRDLAVMPRSPPVVATLGPAAAGSKPGLLRRAVTLAVHESGATRTRTDTTGGGGSGGGSGGNVAFFVRLRALDASLRDVLPATWSDNFVSLLAGEQTTVVLEYEASGTEVMTVTAEPFNAHRS